MVNTTLKARLSDYLKCKGVTKTDFGKKIGVSAAYVSSIRKSIQPEKVSKIAESYPDLNIQWLLTGKGEMLNNGGKLLVTFPDHDRDYEKVEVYKSIIKERDAKIAELEYELRMLKNSI